MKTKLTKLVVYTHFKSVIDFIIDKLDSGEIDSTIFEMTMPGFKKAYAITDIANIVTKTPEQIHSYSKKCDELYKLCQQRNDLADAISKLFLDKGELVSSLTVLEIFDAIVEEMQTK